MEIRLLTESDVDAFWAVRLRGLKEDPEAFGSSYEESVVTPIADVVKRLRTEAGVFVLGAFDPALIGVVGFFQEQGDKRKHIGFIWGLYVIPEARGAKLGKILMQEAISRAAQNPAIEQINLTVSNKAAQKMYESLGFIAYGTEPRALKVGDQYLDEDKMQLQLHNHSSPSI
jgi:ribosomal protein S18 acetylase RimI-like enzyme